MNKIKEREHKFRLIYIQNNNGDVNAYFEMEPFTDEENEALIFSVADVSKEEKDKLLEFVKNVKEKIPEIDEKIKKELKQWSLDRIGSCEKAILRLATYEMFFDDSVDISLAINEAVELSKKYCDKKTSSFINGVLSDIAKG